MPGRNSFLVLKKECGEAVLWLSECLGRAGLQVVQTFDLNDARGGYGQCTRVHHGTELCDCQMVVLLVYQNGTPPASLVAHGRDDQTWFTFVDAPNQRFAASFENFILNALTPHIHDLNAEGIAPAN